MQKITPFLWFDHQAEEAAKFYVSLFKNSKILNIARYGEGAPMPKGTVMTVDFVLEGERFTALNGGPMFKFTEAISFLVNCDSQHEIDTLWNKLTSNGGAESQCGWLKDKYGLSWQIIPTDLGQMLRDPDPEKAQGAMSAMLKMKKIDVEAIRQAYNQSSKMKK